MLGKKSLFPSQEHWQPPGGLATTDIKLLQGPQHAVIDRPRIVIEDESTHKEIVYVAGPYERDTCKHLRSWVQLPTIPDSGCCRTEPVVGRIQRIFSHEFGEQTYDLAVVHKCNSIRRDPDSGLYMWWTNELRYTVVILPVTKLSSPLVVAKEESVIWFLNCNVHQ